MKRPNVDEPAPLVIVGAGGLGRETLAAVRAANRLRPTWAPIGFVDDSPDLAGRVIDGLPVLGPIAWLEQPDRTRTHDGLEVVISTGRPGGTASRTTLARRLAHVSFATIVHPAASLAEGTAVGPGSILLAGVVTTVPLELGAHIVAMPNVVFTHDDVIGDGCMFASNVALGGGVRVEAGAYVGAGAVVRENLSLGAGSLVGMGSVVTRDVPAGAVWAGNPARPLHAVPTRSTVSTTASGTAQSCFRTEPASDPTMHIAGTLT